MISGINSDLPGQILAQVSEDIYDTAKSHTQGRALDLRLPDVNCSDIERFLIEHPRLLARVGCFPNATFFHVDVGRSRGIWFDARVGLD